MASPLQAVASSANPAATRDFASLYVLPGVRLNFAPRARASTFAFGAGYGLFEHGVSRIDGGATDVRVWRFIGARWEVRDFYSVSMAFVVGAGVVLRRGRTEQ